MRYDGMASIMALFPAQCGGTIRAAEGYISSPNFPSAYPGNAVCEWRIIAATGHYLSFNFVTLDIPSTDNCTSGDYVRINDYNSTGPSLGQRKMKFQIR